MYTSRLTLPLRRRHFSQFFHFQRMRRSKWGEWMCFRSNVVSINAESAPLSPHSPAMVIIRGSANSDARGQDNSVFNEQRKWWVDDYFHPLQQHQMIRNLSMKSTKLGFSQIATNFHAKISYHLVSGKHSLSGNFGLVRLASHISYNLATLS